MSSYKLLMKKRMGGHYFESLKNLNVILLNKISLVYWKKMSKKVLSRRLKYLVHLLKRIEAK